MREEKKKRKNVKYNQSELEIGFFLPLAQTGISERAAESRDDGSRTGVWQSFTRLGQHQKESMDTVAQESFPQHQERQPGELSTSHPLAFFAQHHKLHFTVLIP